MPAAVAIPLITAGASAGASIVGAKMASNASKNATKATVDAANKAAEIQSQSSDKALDYEREQAAEDKRRYDEAQQRNYAQYLSRYRAAQALGHSIGFDMPDAPDYYGGSAAGPGGDQMMPTGSGAAPSGIPKATGDLAKDLALANQITGGKGVTQNDLDYWSKAGYAKDPQYFFQKMLGMDAGPQDAPKTGPYAGMSRPAAPAGGGAMAGRSVAAFLNPALGGGAPPPTQDFKLRGLNLYR